MDVKEKRKLERFDLKIPTRVALTGAKKVNRERTIPDLMTSDICSGGAYFHTVEPLPAGSKVKIDLILPLDKLRRIGADWKKVHVRVTGKVLRSESKGMAIGFNRDYRIEPLEKKPDDK